jgi:osmoprotectant transport system substrate-binding protein
MRWLIRFSLAACACALIAGCGGGLDSTKASGGGDEKITVGSSNFPENVLLAQIYAAALRAKGLEVSTKLNVGSREALFPALKRGDVTVAPEYTGGLLDYVSKGKAGAGDVDGQLSELKAKLPSGLTLLKPSDAQDQNTVTCSRPVASKYRLKSLADLAGVSHQLVIGGPPELATRGGFGSLKGLKRLYGIQFARFRPLDVAGPLTVSALKSGKVDCANLFSTQSAIPVNGFVTLSDPKGFAQDEDVVPLIAKHAATPKVVAALDAVSAKLTTDTLKGLVKRVEIDKDDPASVADDFLSREGLDGN